MKEFDLRFGLSNLVFHLNPKCKTYFNSNQLLEELPTNFITNSPNLTDINLSYNSLEVLHDESFSGITGLRHLDLRHNQAWTNK